MSLLPLSSRKPRLWPAGINVPPAIELDASVREEHGLRFAISSSPLEAGALVSDHVFELPEEITLEVVVSRYVDWTPPNVPNFVATRHIRIYDQLKQLARRKQPFDVVTSLAIYTNMVFTEIRAPRSNATTHTLVIECRMRRIEFAALDAKAAIAQAAHDIALGAADVGAAATATVAAAEFIATTVAVEGG